MAIHKTTAVVDGRNHRIEYHPVTDSSGSGGFSGIIFTEPAMVFTVHQNKNGILFEPINTNPKIKEAIVEAIRKRENQINEDIC